MLRVGLTGGIASGKSRVRRRFAEAGCATLDLDHVTHDLLAAGAPGQVAVAREFGPGVVGADGAVDRRALGALVFRDESARARLNALLHPLIRAESDRRAAAAEARGEAVFVSEATLPVENGSFLRFDRLVVVHCSEAQQLERLVGRDGLTPEAAQARIRSQMPNAEKRRFAHFVVDASGAPADTDVQVDATLRALLDLARTPPARVTLGERAALGAIVHAAPLGPRGLSPRSVLRSITEQGGVDLQVLARALDPACEGPWYEAARADAGEPGPDVLASPLALWALVRRGADEGYLAGAAVALARLTHVEAVWAVRAVVAAGLLFDVAVRSTLGGLGERVAHWERLAAGFDVVAATGAWDARATAAAAQAAADDPRGAAQRARAGGGDPALAASLVGVLTGPRDVAPDAALEQSLRQLLHA